MYMKRADTFVTFLEGVFEGHFFNIVVVDFGRVWFCNLCKNRLTNTCFNINCHLNLFLTQLNAKEGTIVIRTPPPLLCYAAKPGRDCDGSITSII